MSDPLVIRFPGCGCPHPAARHDGLPADDTDRPPVGCLESHCPCEVAWETPVACPECSAVHYGRPADPCPACGSLMFDLGNRRSVCRWCKMPCVMTADGWQHAEAADAAFCALAMQPGAPGE